MHDGKTLEQSCAARTGLVVVDPSCNLVASNSEAVQILTFPEHPEKIPGLEAWLGDRIRTRLLDRRASGTSKFVSQFRSQNRTYVCRTFPLSVAKGEITPTTPALVLLLERNSNGMITMREVAERYGLTPREQETVRLLLEGLTSKEIAERMKISPNTVKAFIRLVMVKMDVSTRSGIIGKIAGPQDGTQSNRGIVRSANTMA
jgi:DNA-binding CsgD family transcriptional regulator